MNIATKTNKGRRSAIWCVILLGHLVLLYVGFQPNLSNKSAPLSTSILLQILRPTVTPPLRPKEPEHAPAKRQLAQPKPQEVPARNEETPPSNIAKADIDPFAISTPPTGILERNNRALGQIWKDLEKENPIRRKQFEKIAETPMQRFARQVLAASSARDVTMEESFRADGSRMTRITTPYGVVCAVGPMPGRSFENIGPEKRIVSCP